MKYRTRLLSGFALALSLVAGSAQAILVDNGDTMVDQDTGLEWLDLDVDNGALIGKSWNQAEASTYVQDQGYRHATDVEVKEMFMNAGIVSTNHLPNPANTAGVQLLLEFLGCTFLCGTGFEKGRGFAAHDSKWRVRPYYRQGIFGGAAAVHTGHSKDHWKFHSTGHYLVRTYIPTPAAVWLFASALGLFGWLRYRSKSLAA